VTLLPWLVWLTLVSPFDAVQAARAAAVDPWAPIRFMVGTWRGQTNGQPGVGTSERTYRFEFGETYLRVDNKSVWQPTATNPKGEVHQDTGFFSFDKAQKKLVLRQFHSEGFVNEYVAEPSAPDGKSLAFVTTAIENIPAGWRARERYLLVGPDEFVETFELAAPGKDFERYTECRFRRVK
jgi:hypothetical protein